MNKSKLAQIFLTFLFLTLNFTISNFFITSAFAVDCCSIPSDPNTVLQSINTSKGECQYLTADAATGGNISFSPWACTGGQTCDVSAGAGGTCVAAGGGGPGGPGRNGYCCNYGGEGINDTANSAMRWIKKDGKGACILNDCLNYNPVALEKCLLGKAKYSTKGDGTLPTNCLDADPATGNPGEVCNIYTNKCIPLPKAVESGATCAGKPGQPSGPGVNTAIGCIRTDPAGFVNQAVPVGVGIGSGLSFASILYGTYKLTTSQGNPEGINAGKDIITSAIIGLVFIVLSVTVLQIIGFDLLGLGSFGLGTK